MLTIKEYLSESRNIILKYAGSYSQKLVRDSDAVGSIATTLALADNSYDISKGTKKSTWRIQNGIYKILHLIKDIKDNHTISLDSYLHNEDGHKIDFAERPPVEEGNYDEIIEKNKGILTEKQVQYLNYIFKDGLSQKEVGQKMGVTKQAVSFSLKRATRKLKRHGVFKEIE